MLTPAWTLICKHFCYADSASYNEYLHMYKSVHMLLSALFRIKYLLRIQNHVTENFIEILGSKLTFT
jgi:hypothetical protein